MDGPSVRETMLSLVVSIATSNLNCDYRKCNVKIALYILTATISQPHHMTLRAIARPSMKPEMQIYLYMFPKNKFNTTNLSKQM